MTTDAMCLARILVPCSQPYTTISDVVKLSTVKQVLGVSADWVIASVPKHIRPESIIDKE